MQPARGHWCAAAAVAVAVAVIAISIAPVTEAANVAAFPRHERAEGQPLRSLDSSDSPRLLAERMRRAGRRLLNATGTAGGNSSSAVQVKETTSPFTATPAPPPASPPPPITKIENPKHVVTMTLKLEYSKDQFEKQEVKDKFIIAMAAAANTDKANVKILSIKVRARHCVPVVLLRSGGGGWGRSCVLHAR